MPTGTPRPHQWLFLRVQACRLPAPERLQRLKPLKPLKSLKSLKRLKPLKHCQSKARSIAFSGRCKSYPKARSIASSKCGPRQQAPQGHINGFLWAFKPAVCHLFFSQRRPWQKTGSHRPFDGLFALSSRHWPQSLCKRGKCTHTLFPSQCRPSQKTWSHTPFDGLFALHTVRWFIHTVKTCKSVWERPTAQAQAIPRPNPSLFLGGARATPRPDPPPAFRQAFAANRHPKAMGVQACRLPAPKRLKRLKSLKSLKRLKLLKLCQSKARSIAFSGRCKSYPTARSIASSKRGPCQQAPQGHINGFFCASKPAVCQPQNAYNA